MKCPNCGYQDPFIPSWWDPEKEVAEHGYLKEWDPGLWEQLQLGDVRRGDYLYHLTPSSIERWLYERWISRPKRAKVYYERSDRKNYHIAGKRVAAEKAKRRCTMKVRCRDCKHFSDGRCEAKMKYMKPDIRRYCNSFDAKSQPPLSAYEATEGYTWPP